MRLIDADEMLETLKRKYPQWYTGKPKDSWMHYAWLVYYWAVENAPTVDVAPVRHGRWVQRKIRESQFVQNGYTRLYCSVCGEYSEVKSNYCGNCGAKMDRERKGRKSQYRRVEK